ncbi:MAG: transglutaminase-like domain-containing protein [Gemmatimonadales bacterium]
MRVGAFNRRTAGRLVLLGWAVTLAWLARRELGKTEAQTIREATIRLSPDAHFYAVLAKGHQVGYASVTVDTVPGGFSVAEVMALDVADQDSIRRVTRRTELFLSRSLRLRGFTRTLTGGGLYEELSGRFDGDSVLHFLQRDARDGEPTEWSVRPEGDVVLPQVLPYRLAFSKRLEIGRSVEANVLDLNTGLIAPIEFRATAESTFVVADSAVEQRLTGKWMPVTYDTVKAWRIEHDAAGTPMVSWVDSHGGLVRSEAALGVRIERSAFELVSFNYRVATVARGTAHHRGVPGMQTLAASGIVPPADTGSLSWAVSSAPIERFLMPRVAWLDGGRQRGRDGELEVGSHRPGGADQKSDYLGPPPEAAPAVLALARQIVGKATAEPARIRALARWVASSIALDTAVAAASDVERTLETRSGSPEGHARLFVELARALDLSARPVGGVAVLPSGVYGHAWAEVWLDGGWQAVDPSYGQVPASSRLIRVTVGGTGRAIDLVPLIGSATFASVDPPLPTVGARQ